MNYAPQILFALGFIGTVNSLIVSVFFLFSRKLSNHSNRIFGAFLLILSLRILKSIFYAYSPKEPIWFLQFGPVFFILIGPFLFTYVLSIANAESFWFKKRRYHLLFWFLIVGVMTFLLPFSDHRVLYKSTLLPVINSFWLFFLVLSAFYTAPSLLKKNRDVKTLWLAVLLFGNLILWVVFSFIRFDYFITGSIVFSVLFYALFLVFLFAKKATDTLFPRQKRKKNSFPDEEAELLISELNTLFVSEKPYTNPSLKIADVAEELKISSHDLSKLMNQNLNQSFSDYVNGFRVEEAKQIIESNSNYTIEAIGNMAGFRSKSAFYRAFKSYTKTTPFKYLPNR